MKKKQVNEILVNQTKRRNMIFAFISVIIVVFILSLSFFLVYTKRNQKSYVSYSESSDIDYKVLLKENEFFDKDYLGSNQQYIASLINYIKAKFNYKLSLDEQDVEYKYSYRLEANIDVKEKNTTTSLYNKTEELLHESEKISSEKELNIIENIDIDYNYYNDLIKKFISTYDLEDVLSTLTINMYINVVGSCEELEENSQKESVMSLSIPLTTKTMAIDLSNNLINSENNLMECRSPYQNSYIFLVISILFLLIDFGLIGYIINYAIKTMTAENIYEREFKKILNNYGSYIQSLNNEFDFSVDEYRLLILNTFTDLLEIRDTIRQPILMKQNNEKTGAYFIIPSNTKILYLYRLNVIDIQKELQEKNFEI